MAFNTDLLVNDPKTEKVISKAPTRELKRLSSKIIKMDENNQYGQAITKPLPYSCINRKDKILFLDELSALLASVALDDTIGHLFTIDIEFSDVNPKTLLFNEIYPPIFEKNKKISPYERSISQIMSRAQKKEGKDEIASLPFNSKTHATLNKKIFVSLHAEGLLFLTARAGWKVTKLYDHYYTFIQLRFK